MTAADAPQLTEAELASLRRAFEDLRALADHPIPAVRGGVRGALADLAQVLNAVGDGYELYGADLAP